MSAHLQCIKYKIEYSLFDFYMYPIRGQSPGHGKIVYSIRVTPQFGYLNQLGVFPDKDLVL